MYVPVCVDVWMRERKSMNVRERERETLLRKQNYIKGRQPGHVPSNNFNFVLSLSLTHIHTLSLSHLHILTYRHIHWLPLSLSLLFFSIFDSEQLFFLLVWSFFLSFFLNQSWWNAVSWFVRLFVCLTSIRSVAGEKEQTEETNSTAAD